MASTFTTARMRYSWSPSRSPTFAFALGGIAAEALADGMPNGRRLFLPVAIDAAVALLHHVRIPRNLDVDEVVAVVLEVDALGGGIGREQDADG